MSTSSRYSLSQYAVGSIVFEQIDPHSPYRNDQSEPESGPPSLEREIDQLRDMLEQAFTHDRSFTSDVVMQVSMRLDEKINQYMKRERRMKEH